MHESDEECAVTDNACGCPAERCWVVPAALVLVLVGVVTSSALWRAEAPSGSPAAQGTATSDSTSAATSGPPSPRPKGQTVSLRIDFGNGATREFAALSWREGMTAADLMEMAAQFRPPLAFSGQGEGELAFITAIEGITAEGSGGRNWILYVDGQKSQKGAGSVSLDPGNTVLWKYESYE